MGMNYLADNAWKEPRKGYRDAGSVNGGYTPGYAPKLASGNPAKELEPYKNSWYDWSPAYANKATALTQYHKFPCSKCHNPHASRLPKLMISNCLDTNHNTWQTTTVNTGYANQIDGNTSTAEPWSPESNRTFNASNWATSQNCHRRGMSGQLGNGRAGDLDGQGWNKVTPW